MKKSGIILAGMVLALSLSACAASGNSTSVTNTQSATQDQAQSTEAATNSETASSESSEVEQAHPEFVTIETKNGAGESVSLEIPFGPDRIAVLDVAALDIIDILGEGASVVGTANTSVSYLQSYVNSDKVANLGTIKEADLEAVMACEPDVIFIGGRLSKNYDALSEIAPVVLLSTDNEIGVVESVRANLEKIASLFGKEEQVADLMSGFEGRIAALNEKADGQSAIVGLCTGGAFNVLGNDGRCSVIGKEIGFDNVGVDSNIDTSTHGNEASFEFIVEKAPAYVFVLDRDAAIGADGATPAREIMENELVMETDAYKNEQIVYLEHPDIWYTAEGGVNALDIMLADLESALK